MAVQSLELEIRDNADQASESITSFANRLFQLSVTSYYTNRRLSQLVNTLRQINGLTGQSTGLGQMVTYLKDISQGMHAMYQAVININNAINFQTRVLYDAITALGKYMSATGGASKGADVFGNSANDAAKKSHEMAAGMEEVERTTESTRQAFSEFGNSAKGSGLGEAMEELEETTESTKESFEAIKTSVDAANGKTSEFYRSMKESFGITSEGTKETNAFKDAMDRLGNSMNGVRQRFHGLFSSFTRILKFRVFRTIIREIADAFGEGLKNVRKYSEAIHGLYARDMDQLDNSLLKMKNSLGAALAPAIQALLPLLQTLISYLIQAANAFNQFMALMNGRGQWTKAIDVVASDFEDAKKAATGAAKAAKGLLASWDELNIIQSEAGGGGGSGRKKKEIDYTKMFEESFQFEGWIRDLVNFLQEHLPVVHGLLAGILGMFLGISDLGTLFVTIGLITTFENTGDIAKNGFTKSNIATGLIAALESGLGGLFTGFTIGGMTTGLLGLVTGFSISAGIQLVAGFDFYFSKDEFDKAIGAGLLAIIAFGMAGSSITKAAGIGSMAEGFFLGATIGLSILMISAFRMSYKEDDVLGAILSGFGVVASAAAGGYAWGTQFGFKPQSTIIGATIGVGILMSLIFDTSYEEGDIITAVGTGLGAVAAFGLAGWQIGQMNGNPTSGALIGIGVGALVTFGLKFATDYAEGDIAQAIGDGFVMLAAGGLVGWQVGKLVGHPAAGFLIGMGVSAAITLGLSFFCGDKDFSQKDLVDAIGLGLGTVGASGMTGWMIGKLVAHPIEGALIGIGVGALVTLILSFGFGDKDDMDKKIQVSEEELKKYVAANLFETDINATISIMETTVTNMETARDKVAESLAEMTVPLRKLTLGIDKEQAYSDLLNTIFGPANEKGERSGGLIGRVQSYADSAQKTIELSLTLMPHFNNTTGTDDSGELMLFSQQNWTEINGTLITLGNDLAKMLEKGFTDGIANFDEVAAQEIIDKITKISSAVTQATLVNEAAGHLMMNLASGDMTVFQAYSDYLKELRQAAINTKFAEAAAWDSEAAGLRAMAEDETDPDKIARLLTNAKRAEDLAQEAREGAGAYAEMVVSENAKTGKQLLVQNAAISDTALARSIKQAQEQAGGIQSWVTGILVDIATGGKFGSEVSDSLAGKNVVENAIKAVIENMYGEGAYGTLVGEMKENPLDWIPEDVKATMAQYFGMMDKKYLEEWMLPYLHEATSLDNAGLDFFKERFGVETKLQQDYGYSAMEALQYLLDSLTEEGTWEAEIKNGRNPLGMFTGEQLAYMKSTDWWTANFGEADIEGPLNVTAPEVNVSTPPGGYSTDDEDDNKDSEELTTQTGILRQILTAAQAIQNKPTQQIGISARLGWVVEQSMKEWNRLNGRTGTGVAGATDLGP